MSNPVWQIRVALGLDPQNESDRLALTMLQRWFKRAEVLNQGNEKFDFFKLKLHKEIYMSGLFLCLLEPKLVKYFSRNLHGNCLTTEFLHQALADHRLTDADRKQVVQDDPLNQLSPDELASRIADQLQPLLTALGSQSAQHDDTSVDERNAQLQTQVSMMSQQLQEQSRLLQQQARLLDSLARNGGGAGPARPAESQGQGGQADGPVQLHDLSETAAKVRKVRAKGVF